MIATIRTDVLVVGGGLVGHATAAFLAQQGVPTVLVEQQDGTARHPRARLVTVRSMELFRSLGIEPEILAAGEPNSGFVLADTLAADHEAWIAPPAEEIDAADLSPSRPYSCDQVALEPILRRRAEHLGVDVRFATRAHCLDAPDRITAADTVRFRLDGPHGSEVVDARFVVAADGAHSPLRTLAGIGMQGTPIEGSAVSALFRADLDRALQGRQVAAVMCRSAGAFLFARGNPAERTWQFGTYVRPGWDTADVPALRVHLGPLIKAATGLPDVEPDILGVQTWSSGALVAQHYRRGPVFLAGDAAHVMPPYGGFGGNTGIADAHNLAWKLAHVCRGDAPVSLLDTYTTERRSLGSLTVDQALLRSKKIPGAAPPPDEIDATTLQLGFRYPEHEGDPADVEDPTSPSGAPGTRAPHVALDDGSSLLDRLDPTCHSTIVGDLPPCRDDDAGARTVRIPRDSVAPRHLARWDGVYQGRRTTIRPDGIVAHAGRPEQRVP